jgi:hypothetical protein
MNSPDDAFTHVGCPLGETRDRNFFHLSSSQAAYDSAVVNDLVVAHLGSVTAVTGTRRNDSFAQRVYLVSGRRFLFAKSRGENNFIEDSSRCKPTHKKSALCVDLAQVSATLVQSTQQHVPPGRRGSSSDAVAHCQAKTRCRTKLHRKVWLGRRGLGIQRSHDLPPKLIGLRR